MSHNLTLGTKSTTKESTKDNWNTSWDAVRDAEYLIDKFDVDVASFEHAKKAPVCITPEQDSLKTPWFPYVVDGVAWCNPPFSRKAEFLEKAFHESKMYGLRVCVMIPLEPATHWWMKHVYRKATIVFIPDGRYNYVDDATKEEVKGVSFASCFVYFDGSGEANATEYVHFKRGVHKKNMEYNINTSTTGE